LLKRSENLDEKRTERQRLDEALQLNQTLAGAHYLKEDLRQIGAQRSLAAGTRGLDDWIRRAEVS